MNEESNMHYVVSDIYNNKMYEKLPEYLILSGEDCLYILADSFDWADYENT